MSSDEKTSSTSLIRWFHGGHTPGKEMTDKDFMPATRRDPKYDPKLEVLDILQQWTKLMAENGTLYDTGFAARESICELVYYNSYDEEIIRHFPKGFPRERETAKYLGLSYAGCVFGSITLALAIIAAIGLNI